ncbi:MAG TPA: hypothetical protein VM347_12800 [Nonomuraea sp.]|nr:hypothetical protein [Nonomuraea sp.]
MLDISDDMCGELIFTVFAAIAKFQRQQKAPAKASTPPAPEAASAAVLAP